MELDNSLKKLANIFSLWTDRVISPESTLPDSLKFIADLPHVLKEVFYQQVMAIGNCICEVLMRTQQKYCDINPWQEKFVVNYGKIQAWTEIRTLASAVGALHSNRRGHIQAIQTPLAFVARILATFFFSAKAASITFISM